MFIQKIRNTTKIKKLVNAFISMRLRANKFGAGSGTRTHTPLRITDFESVSSANSDTPANKCLISI